MLFKPEYDENGKKVLCEMNGINSEMLMDIYVKKLKKGETLEIIEENNECAILLLSGDVTFKVGNEIDEHCKRKNCACSYCRAGSKRCRLPRRRSYFA